MCKILICDDEILERKALRIIIQRRYPEVCLVEDATTGQEAISLARRHAPDIILMDITMPKLNGLDAQREIIQFLPAVKTVVITAYNDFSYAQQAIKHGVCDFLLKPIAPEALYECLNKVMPSVGTGEELHHPPLTDNSDMIQMITEFIDHNYLNNLHLSDLARQFHLSEKYLSRYFKQKTGASITEYITKQRLSRSKYLLCYTEIPIYQIAMELNFSDSSYFTKVFQKHEGISPLQYRKDYKTPSR